MLRLVETGRYCTTLLVCCPIGAGAQAANGLECFACSKSPSGPSTWRDLRTPTPYRTRAGSSPATHSRARLPNEARRPLVGPYRTYFAPTHYGSCSSNEFGWQHSGIATLMSTLLTGLRRYTLLATHGVSTAHPSYLLVRGLAPVFNSLHSRYLSIPPVQYCFLSVPPSCLRPRLKSPMAATSTRNQGSKTQCPRI